MAIGERLKEAREKQNISLEKMQETTKIQKRYLEALENENFSVLPGTFYARAFIKEYATAVGLDSSDLLEEYNAELPAEEDSTAHYSQIHRSRKENNPSKGTNVFSFIPTVIVVLLIIGIVFIVWFFMQESSTEDSSDSVQSRNDNEVVREQEDESEKDKAAEDNEADAEEKGKAKAESTQSQNENPDPALTVDKKGTGNAGGVPESTLTLEHAGGDVPVTIQVKNDSWLGVKNGDGDILFKDTATTDDSPIELDVSEADRVWFKVGNAPALDITIDGADLEYPVDPNDDVFQKIWVNLDKEEDSGN